MMKNRALRIVVIVLLIAVISALASYGISSLTAEKDPLEGTWVCDDYGFEYGIKFKNGTSTISVNGQDYSPIEYKIIGTESDGTDLVVSVMATTDTESYTDKYTVKEGGILEYDGVEYEKQ